MPMRVFVTLSASIFCRASADIDGVGAAGRAGGEDAVGAIRIGGHDRRERHGIGAVKDPQHEQVGEALNVR